MMVSNIQEAMKNFMMDETKEDQKSRNDPLITIIAGSRTIQDYAEVERAIKHSKFNISEVISGGARGVDKLGETYAYEHKIPLTIYRANWDKYGKRAGIFRNRVMATHADALIAVWDGQSNGTKHMIEVAKEYGLHVFIYYV
jgi:predicted Rossmann fold nucleotide-binding protein DprA/Smf involved in DNA uptake